MTRSNLKTLVSACETVLSLNEFWILAELTDNSYEVGNCSHFRDSIEPYRRFGLPANLMKQLDEGINGNLANALGCKQNKRGQDVEFRGPDSRHARAEVKLVHTVTYAKYYPCVAADITKLAGTRTSFDGDLFLAVFFAHFPCYKYPAGSLRNAPFPGRKFRTQSIQDQFGRVHNLIGRKADWPIDAPRVHRLHEPSEDVLRMIGRWCDEFSMKKAWKFNSQAHLSGATVGCAIWQIT